MDLFDDDDTVTQLPEVKIGRFDRQKRRDIVRKWWKWAERQGIDCIADWDHFVNLHCKLSCALGTMPIWWSGPIIYKRLNIFDKILKKYSKGRITNEARVQS